MNTQTLIAPVSLVTPAIAAAIEKAGTSWQGLEWDSDLQDIATCVVDGEWIDLDRACSIAEDRDGALISWLPADGSFSAQALRSRAQALGASLVRGIAQHDAEEAADLATEESNIVESHADAAREAGGRVLACLRACDLSAAHSAASDAVRIEGTYGDAPAWGPVLALVEAMVDAADVA